MESRSDECSLNELRLKQRKPLSQYEEINVKKDIRNMPELDFTRDVLNATQVTEINKEIYKKKFGESVTK